MEEIKKGGTEVGVVAETIYAAATDGTDRLRYLVGEDAKAFATQLASVDGEDNFAHMTTMFRL